jgi:hypothetical protein
MAWKITGIQMLVKQEREPRPPVCGFFCWRWVDVAEQYVLARNDEKAVVGGAWDVRRPQLAV